MPSKKKQYRVFIASPSDLAQERRAFKEIIDELNDGFAAGADTTLVPLAWEETFSTVGRRSQSVINDLVDQCDCFVLVLHRRWGQKAPDSNYSSYTEEEFYRALERFQKTGEPRIFIFLKNIDSAFMADPGEQLKKVLAFRRQLEETRQVLYRTFNDSVSFSQELNEHLKALIKGKLPAIGSARNIVMLPLLAIERVEKAEGEAERLRKEAEALRERAEAKDLQITKTALFLADKAAKAAHDGRIEEARQNFAIATDGTNNLDVLSLAAEFHFRIGELNRAEELLKHSLSISGPDEVTNYTAAAYGTLGLIYQNRDDLDMAETMHRKALEIQQLLGDQEPMVSLFSNLRLLLEKRGEFEKAEEINDKAIEVNKQLGRKIVSKQVTVALAIPDNDPIGLSSSIAIAPSGTLQGISIEVDISHTWVGDLQLMLMSPSGQKVLLHDRQGNSGDDLLSTYSLVSVPALEILIGNEIKGDWVLVVRDLSALDVGKLNKWSLELSYH